MALAPEQEPKVFNKASFARVRLCASIINSLCIINYRRALFPRSKPVARWCAPVSRLHAAQCVYTLHCVLDFPREVFLWNFFWYFFFMFESFLVRSEGRGKFIFFWLEFIFLWLFGVWKLFEFNRGDYEL